MMRKWSVVALMTLVAGCSGTLPESRVEYKSASKLPPLEIPPDLTAPARDNRYQLPDTAKTGTATYSAYSSDRASGPRNAEVLPAVSASNIRVERAGGQRWLVVPQSPDKLWPTVKEFWQEQGFLIRIESPETGVMETDWAENRAKIPLDPIRSFLGKAFEGMYSTSERDKFRTRLERTAEPGATEVYISHRGVAEVYTSQRQDYTVWQARPSDPDLEAEFLRRLMLRLGVSEEQAKVQVASATVTERAKIVRTADGATQLDVDEPFDRAWRRVGLALDRVGFTVEDRDRSKGVFYVRYVDPEKDAQGGKKDDSFLSKLAFWRPSAGDPRSAEQYRVQIRDKKDTSQVEVLNKDGQPDKSESARKILSLLHEQLK